MADWLRCYIRAACRAEENTTRVCADRPVRAPCLDHARHRARYRPDASPATGDDTMSSTLPVPDLRAFAALVAEQLRDHFPTDAEQLRQVLSLAEEVGEFIGAWRRWNGLARRSGSWNDVEAELADVLITAYVTGQVLNIPLPPGGHHAERSCADPHRAALELFMRAAQFVDAYHNRDRGQDLLLDVVRHAHATAATFGIDLEAAWRRKATTVLTRPWREPAQARGEPR